jgi:hypothetical protein
MDVPFNIDHYDFRVSDVVCEVVVAGRVRPQLHINWNNFRMVNKYVHLTFTPPDSLPLSIRQATIIKRIIDSPYYVLLYSKTASGAFDILPLYRSVWASTSESRHCDTVLTLQERPPLYPSIVAV